jgi:hypothetical protein
MIDWMLILNKLRSQYKHMQPVKADGTCRGMRAVAYACGGDADALNKIARGEVQEPKYSVGVELLKLYDKYCN